MITKFIKGKTYFLTTDDYISPVIFTPDISGTYVSGKCVFQDSDNNENLLSERGRLITTTCCLTVSLSEIYDSNHGFIIELPEGV